MKQPSIQALQEKNPDFFGWGEKFQDQERQVVKEGPDWVLKILTSRDTRPVYAIGADLSLNYIRHGW